jgi:hypothetical protein
MFFARPSQMLDHKRVAVICSIKAATSKGGLEAGRRGEDFRGGGIFKDPRVFCVLPSSYCQRKGIVCH